MIGKELRRSMRQVMAVVGIGGSIIWLAINYHFLWVSETTVGTLIGEPQRHEVSTRRRQTEYFVNYVFEVNGQRYQGKDSVTEYPSKPTVIVYYNRDNPNDNKAERPAIMGWWLVFGLSFLLWVITWFDQEKGPTELSAQNKI